jgi:predicted dehydrogenase
LKAVVNRQTETRNLKVAVAGLGFGAAVHVPALKKLPGVNVVAIAGRTMEKAVKAAHDLDIPHAVADFRQLADFRPDAVTIALPPEENSAAAAFFMDRGIAVLCEKPIATDIASARRLFELGQNRVHAVDFQFAELPAFAYARQALLEGKIGSLKNVQVNWQVESYANRNKLNTWKREASGTGGGILPLFASHAFYLMEWLNGPLKEISATLLAEGGPWHQQSPIAPDTAQLEIVFENDATLIGEMSNAAPEAHLHIWEMFGERGSIRIENLERDYMSGFSTILVKDNEKHVLHAAEDLPGIDGRLAPFASLAERFLSAVRSEEATYPDFRSGWHVQCAIDACVKSHREGRPVLLAEYKE